MKLENPDWKTNPVGGVHRQAFSGPQLELIELVLWNIIQVNPLLSLKEILKTLNVCGFSTNRTWLSNKFAAWRWSFRKPSFKQTHKYRPQNIEYYARYMAWVSTIPWVKLKFLDESSFSSRGEIFIVFAN